MKKHSKENLHTNQEHLDQDTQGIQSTKKQSRELFENDNSIIRQTIIQF